MRTRAAWGDGPVTVQPKLPALALGAGGAAAVRSSHGPRLFRSSSIRTRARIPRLWLHLIVWSEPIGHLTFVFGFVTVTEAVPATILKTPLELSEAMFPEVSLATARTRAFGECGPGASQRQLRAAPGRSWHPWIGVKLPPPLTETGREEEAQA